MKHHLHYTDGEQLWEILRLASLRELRRERFYNLAPINEFVMQLPSAAR